jgi:hypothetical protein
MKMHPNNHVLPLLALACYTLVPANSSHASEYSLEYSVEAGYEYNDNVGFSSDDEIDVSGGLITFPVTLTRRTERLETALSGEATSTKYDDSDFDSDDQDLNLRSSYQLERGGLNGYAGYKRDSTRTSEFLDTGVVGLRATRVERASAGASGDYMFTEKNGILLGADYSDVEYDSPIYSDYDYVSGNFGWRHQWREQTSLILQGTASRYENDGETEVTSDTLGVQAGFETQVSEALKASLLMGWAGVETDYSSNSTQLSQSNDSNDVFQMNGKLRYRQERYDLSAEVRSGTRPSGDGTLNEDHQVNLKYGYSVTERSNLDLTLIVGTTESLESDTNRERDYARARVRLDYRLTESWYVAGTYMFSYQDRNREDGSADSNQVNLSLIFQPEKHIWSR